MQGEEYWREGGGAVFLRPNITGGFRLKKGEKLLERERSPGIQARVPKKIEKKRVTSGKWNVNNSVRD